MQRKEKRKCKLGRLELTIHSIVQNKIQLTIGPVIPPEEIIKESAVYPN